MWAFSDKFLFKIQRIHYKSNPVISQAAAGFGKYNTFRSRPGLSPPVRVLGTKKEHPKGCLCRCPVAVPDALLGANAFVARRPLPLAPLPAPAPGGGRVAPRTLTSGSSPRHQKRAPKRVLFFGAGGRTRTGTVSPPVDFESTTSTIPSHRLVCIIENRRIPILAQNKVAAFQAAKCRQRLWYPADVLGANACVPRRPLHLLRLRFLCLRQRSGSQQ